jgi:hypothetical protein
MLQMLGVGKHVAAQPVQRGWSDIKPYHTADICSAEVEASLPQLLQACGDTVSSDGTLQLLELLHHHQQLLELLHLNISTTVTVVTVTMAATATAVPLSPLPAVVS